MRRALPFAIMIATVAPACNAGAAAQGFPRKPIRFVTSEPGGGADFVARVIAQGIAPALGQNVVVENRSAVIIPGELVARAVPDGHTLLVFGGTFWLAPFLREHVPYDPQRDFSPVTLAVSSPNLIVVHPAVAATTVKDLIALTKAKPGELNYGATTGASSHLAAELFKAMTGAEFVRIPYKGTGLALNALIGAQVQLMFPSVGAASPHLRSGRLRALAVASAQPSALAPGLPTIAETVPGYESVSVIGVFGPAHLQYEIVRRLNREITAFLRTPAADGRFRAAGAETVGSTAEELGLVVKAEMARLGKLIRTVGIRAE